MRKTQVRNNVTGMKLGKSEVLLGRVTATIFLKLYISSMPLLIGEKNVKDKMIMNTLHFIKNHF